MLTAKQAVTSLKSLNSSITETAFDLWGGRITQGEVAGIQIMSKIQQEHWLSERVTDLVTDKARQ